MLRLAEARLLLGSLRQVITAIPCVTFTSLDKDHWFQTILLTVFTTADVIGRFSVRFRGPLDHSNVWLTLIFRKLLRYYPRSKEICSAYNAGNGG